MADKIMFTANNKMVKLNPSTNRVDPIFEINEKFSFNLETARVTILLPDFLDAKYIVEA
jgi:hypothetical protein